ncbi:MAG TPA: hypothetical protein VG222_01720 [Vicinamibacterales bacterium]|nr:hypothetical protein [Vicinamibacterales bacterium]
MSLDEQAVSAFIGAAVRRARRLAVVEACAWAMSGAAAAAGMSLLTRATPILALSASVLAALVVVSVWFAHRWRVRASRAVVVQRIEHAEPSLRNLLVTAYELLGASGRALGPRRSAKAFALRLRLHASPHTRSRVFADAATHVRSIDVAAAISRSSALRAVSVAAVVWLLVGGAPCGCTRVAQVREPTCRSGPVNGRTRPVHPALCV